MSLVGRTALVTGASRRIGKYIATRLGQSGANVIVHYARSAQDADQVVESIKKNGVQAWAIQADFANPKEAAALFVQARQRQPVDILINNASIFEPLAWSNTTLPDWQRHMDVNLTAPFLLSQTFAASLPPQRKGNIVNILDWRALRPGPDHFPYTISKAALAALTQSLAAALAPNINVNGLALGAILPPSDGGDADRAIEQVPAGRWAHLEEVWEALVFLLSGPDYITGEILHLDGGRHLI